MTTWKLGVAGMEATLIPCRRYGDASLCTNRVAASAFALALRFCAVRLASASAFRSSTLALASASALALASASAFVMASASACAFASTLVELALGAGSSDFAPHFGLGCCLMGFDDVRRLGGGCRADAPSSCGVERLHEI
jgi:hypothetical protein